MNNQTGSSDPCTVDTVKHPDGLVLSRISGTMNAVLTTRLRFELMGHLDGSPIDWIVDATGLSKVERVILEPFVQTLCDFKARGGERVAVAVSNDGIRMILSTVSMSSAASAGPTVEILPSLEAAFLRLGKRLSQPAEGA